MQVRNFGFSQGGEEFQSNYDGEGDRRLLSCTHIIASLPTMLILGADY